MKFLMIISVLASLSLAELQVQELQGRAACRKGGEECLTGTGPAKEPCCGGFYCTQTVRRGKRCLSTK